MSIEGPNPGSETHRVKPLDGLRGIAALLVVAFHYIFIRTQAEPTSLLYYLRAPLKLGWSGVDLFFILSGFLITTILIRARGSVNYFAVFYVRRICRIFPLYFLVLGAFLVAQLLLPPQHNLLSDPLPLWTYLLFVQNIAMGLSGRVGAEGLSMTWSLAVEEQFYLFVPLIVLLLSPRKAVPVLLVLAAVPPLLRFLIPADHLWMVTPFRGDALVLGSLLAYLMLNARFVAACRDNVGRLYLVLVVLLAGVPVLAVRREWFGPFDFTWLSCLFFMLVLIVQIHSQGRLARALSGPILIWFGNVSYAIYMFHMLVGGVTNYLINDDHALIRDSRDVLVTVLAFAITCALAALSGRFLERPLREFGHRWHFRRPDGSRSFVSPVPSLGDSEIAIGRKV